LRINLIIKPNSTKGPLVERQADGSLVVYIREIAADGKANEALVKLLAKHFGVPKTHITIIRGYTSRHKLIDITSSTTCKNKP
jgi:uncharacterized protein (TIGR00251 family)